MTGRISIERFLKVLFILFFLDVLAFGQTTGVGKQVAHASQSWISVNSTMRFTDHWGLMADFHIRKDDFFTTDYFYFLRVGAVTWINGKYPVAYGMAHLWLAPKAGSTTWTNENRIYQQWSAMQPQGIISVFHRIRTEQRWRDVITNDEKTGEKQFSFRLRYLASFDVRIFKNKKMPTVVLSDELLAQFGKNIELNTFDQNRLFAGLKVPVRQNLSFDIGYMNILQQKSTGYQYESTNFFRLFFYYTPDFRRKENDFSQTQME